MVSIFRTLAQITWWILCTYFHVKISSSRAKEKGWRYFSSLLIQYNMGKKHSVVQLRAGHMQKKASDGAHIPYWIGNHIWKSWDSNCLGLQASGALSWVIYSTIHLTVETKSANSSSSLVKLAMLTCAASVNVCLLVFHSFDSVRSMLAGLVVLWQW